MARTMFMAGLWIFLFASFVPPPDLSVIRVGIVLMAGGMFFWIARHVLLAGHELVMLWQNRQQR